MPISFVTITGESVTVMVGDQLHTQHCLGCAIATSWGGGVVLRANSVASEQMRALKLEIWRYKTMAID